MFWSSMLPVTIFVLANTVCVSQSAATGRQRSMNIQPELVAADTQPGDDTDLPLQPDFPLSSSSSESVLPEWINSHPDKGLEDEELESVPLSPGGPLHLGYGSDFGLEEGISSPRERLQPVMYFNRLHLPEIVETPRNTHDGNTARRFHYRVNGMGGLKPLDKLRLLPVVSTLPQQIIREQHTPAMWPAKSNYRVPAEDFIRVNGFDKRSPRCIAKCMQQGMVHPLQCHSLC